MEIIYLKNHQIDKQKWDNCIAKSFNGIIYAYSWYLDIVCEEWDALVDADYQRVFPLPVKKKYGINLVYQPFFTQQLGVISRKILTQEIVAEFLNSIPPFFRYVEIHLNSFNKIDQSRYIIKPFLNHELDLINNYQNIHKKYSINLKRKLKNTATRDLFINPGTKPDDIINLFVNHRGKEIPHLCENEYIVLKRLVYAAIHRGIAQVYGVYTPRNSLCAGGIFLLGNGKLTFLFSGMNHEGRELNALPFLIDHVIRINSNKHLTLDFEGSNDSGLARFYKSFGSKEIVYYNTVINHLKFPFNLGFKLSRKYRYLFHNKLIFK